MGLIIHAPNIHGGGGRTLLIALLEACAHPSAILDERLEIPRSVHAKSRWIHRVSPTLYGRLQAERLLRSRVGTGDVVLCMGNLPPLFGLRGRVLVFVQNRLLVESAPDLAAFPRAARLRMRLERVWLALRKTSVHQFIVQTESMLKSLQSTLSITPLVAPFLAEAQQVKRRIDATVDSPRKYDFVYVASGEPHKNHEVLVEAWALLAQAGLFPTLCLTVKESDYPRLAAWIEQKSARHSMRIVNLGALPPESVLALYRDSKALIYASTLESFGLPLVEARKAGLPILAGELDYVRDLVDPEESFDPQSARSIARAVARFLGVSQPDCTMADASTFLDSIAGDH